MKRFIALLLCVLLVAPGCATSQGPRAQTAPQALAHPDDRAVLEDFARQIPIGSRIRATTVSNRTIRGTLLKLTDQALVLQPRARVAEPPVEVRLNTLLALEQEIPVERYRPRRSYRRRRRRWRRTGGILPSRGVAGRLNGRQPTVIAS